MANTTIPTPKSTRQWLLLILLPLIALLLLIIKSLFSLPPKAAEPSTIPPTVENKPLPLFSPMTASPNTDAISPSVPLPNLHKANIDSQSELSQDILPGTQEDEEDTNIQSDLLQETGHQETSGVRSLLEHSSRTELLHATALSLVSQEDRQALVKQSLQEYGLAITDNNQIAVQRVEQGSVLGLVGLKEGAVISSVNGKQPHQLLNDPHIIFRALTAEQVTLKYTDNGQERTLSLPLSGI